MIKSIHKTQKILQQSPLVILSALAGLWSSLRLLLLLSDVGSQRNAPFDVPFFTFSPLALPLNLGLTLTLVTIIGVVTGTMAIFRQKERWRCWAMPLIILNITDWLITARLFAWAFI